MSPDFRPEYGTTLGPVGVPMTDQQAWAVESLLKAAPAEARADTQPVHKAALGPALMELSAGERADVSYITTEGVDRDREVVLTSDVNDDAFGMNPMVTLNHSYWSPPVGKSLWPKKVVDGDVRGVMAKTHYPARPSDWPQGESWTPDEVFALVRTGLCLGKSIGFIATKSHAPTEGDIRKHPECNQDDQLRLRRMCCVRDILTEAKSIKAKIARTFKSHVDGRGARGRR